MEAVGIMGELFPGKKLTDEGSEDSSGQPHRPRLEVNLDDGVIRIAPTNPPTTEDAAN
ncbi:hypothetical protein Ntsu_67220 [Nocardia sp. IFM 10818]